MKVINLRDIYPHYTQDCFVEVTDEVADLFSEFDHKEAAYRLRTYRHKAYYSLDRNDGIEHEALFVALYEQENLMKKTYPSIPGLEPDAWSNDACRGYVIMAMHDCGFSHEDIRRVVRQLHEAFDFHTINEAEQKYYHGDY